MRSRGSAIASTTSGTRVRPSALVGRRIAPRSGGERAFFETARTVETTTTDLLAERRPDLSLATNVEFYTAVLLHGIGIPSELFTATFAIARVGGWTAHCLEQLDDNRIIRPRSSYIGGENREWSRVEDR